MSCKEQFWHWDRRNRFLFPMWSWEECHRWEIIWFDILLSHVHIYCLWEQDRCVNRWEWLCWCHFRDDRIESSWDMLWQLSIWLYAWTRWVNVWWIRWMQNMICISEWCRMTCMIILLSYNYVFLNMWFCYEVEI